jgi:thiazole/oxazole-forming peptide maturase SagC family component
MSEANGNLRIKRHYSIIAHSPDVVELRYGVWNPISHVLTDDTESGHLFNLVSALDGSSSARELALQEKVSQEEVEALLDHLIQLGVVESGPSNVLDHYLDNIVPTLGRFAARSPTARSAVLFGDPALTGEIKRYLEQSLPQLELAMANPDDKAFTSLWQTDPSRLSNTLEFQRLLVQFEAWRGRLLIVVMRVIQPLQLRLLNRVSLALSVPWIHAALDGPFLLIGPVFVPHRTACYECFETRVTMNMRESASYQQYKKTLVEGQVRNAPMPAAPILTGLLATHTAFEAMNFLLTENAFTVGKALAIYLPTMEFAFNDVLRLPGCSACYPPARESRELYFDIQSLISS